MFITLVNNVYMHTMALPYFFRMKGWLCNYVWQTLTRATTGDGRSPIGLLKISGKQW